MQPKSFLRTLTIIHRAACIGLIIFTIVVYMQNGRFEASMHNDIFVFVIPIVAMVGYFASTWVYQNLIQNLPKTEGLSKKLQRYCVALLIKYAIIEASAFLALFAYYYSGNAIHLVIALCLIVYLFFQRPTKEKLNQEIPLNLEENKEFDTLNPN